MAKASTAPQAEQHEDVTDKFLDGNLPKESIHGLVHSHGRDPMVLQHAAEHENTGEHTLQHIYNEAEKHGPKRAKEIRDAVLNHPNAPRDVVKQHFDAITPDSYKSTEHEHILFHPNITHEEASKKLREIVTASGLENEDEDSHYSSGRWDRRYHAKQALKRHLHGQEDTPASEYEHYVQSKNPEIRNMAGTAPRAPEHVQMEWAKGIKDKAAASEALDEKGLSEGVVGEIYKKFKDVDEDSGDYNKSWKIRAFHKNLAEHPNAPKEHLQEIIDKGISEEDYYGHSARAAALAHPKISKEEIAKAIAANPKDHDALHAAVEREDTDPAHLILAAQDRNTYRDKLSSMAEKAIRHPNYPHEEIMKRIKGSTEEARAVLARSDLSEEQLKALVNHKNKNVAIDALKHHSVTEGVVQEAFKRKAADVSRAAALHPLLPKEQKMEKTLKDPQAAAKLAATTDDPSILEAIFEAHPTNNEVFETISKNAAITPKLMEKMHATQENNPDAFMDRYRSKRDHTRNFAHHPKLPDSVRKAMIKNGNHDALEHPNSTIQDVKEAMDHFKESGDRDTSYHLGHAVKVALNHKGLTPELAKEIVQGNYGPASFDDSYGKPKFDVNSRPDVFTPEVVDAALSARPELASHGVVQHMARSKHLSSDKIGEMLNRPSQLLSDRHAILHRQAVINGLMSNPNLTENQIESAVLGRAPAVAHVDMPDYVLDHPNLTKDGIKRLADVAAGIAQNDDGNIAHIRDMDKALAKKLMEGAKESGDESHISDILRNGKVAPFLNHFLTVQKPYSNVSSEFSKEGLGRFATILKENKNPKVLQALLATHDKELRNLQGGKTHADGYMTYRPEDLATLKDSIQGLAEHPSSDVRNEAFSLLSPEGQNKVLQANGGDLDPDIIKQMKPESIKNLKITPNMSDEQVGAFLKHAGATPEHLQQAVEHSPVMARSALEKAKGSSHSNFDDLANKAMELHPNDDGIVSMAARSGSNELAGRILNELPKHVIGQRGWGNAGIAREIVENKNLKADDLKALTKFNAPEMQQAFESALGSERLPADVLHHIVKTYPNLITDVARHPKAISGKVVKAIMKTGDPKAMAALADNDKIPHELQTELFKNPAVLLGSKQSRRLEDDQLQPHLESKDPQILSVIAMHPNASKETASNAVRSLLKVDPQGEHMANVASRGLHTFDKEVQEAIIKSSEENAATAIKNVDHYEVTPEVLQSAHQALDLYPEDWTHSVVGAVLDKNWNDKSLILKAMNLASFTGDKAEDRVMRFEGLIKRHKDPAIVEAAYKKVKDFSASGGFDKASSGTHHVMKDLFKTIAANSPTSIQEELSNEPHLDGVLMSNKSLSGQALNKILDRQLRASESGQWSKSEPVFDHHDLHAASKNENLTSSEVDKLFSLFEKRQQYKADDHDGFTQALRSLSNHAKLSPATAERILNVYPNDAILSNPAIGTENIRKTFLKGNVAPPESMPRYSLNADVIPHLAMNPALRLKDIKPFIEDGKQDQKANYAALLRHLPKNPGAAPEDLQEAYDSFKDSKEGAGGDFGKHLIQNSNTPGHILEDMVAKGHVKPEDVWASPAAGGDLFRKAPHKFPKGEAFSNLKTEINQAFFRPQEDKIRNVVRMIPPGGHLDWAEFKKANPSLAANPAINKMFTSAPKTRLTQEHAEKYLKSVPGQKEFHISYKPWTGMQRHSDMPEMVFQINNGPAQNQFYRENPAAARMYSGVINYSIGSHPVSRQGIGWSRVDVSHPEEYFIDEIQSDYDANLSKQLHDLQEKGFAKDLENHGYGDAKDQRKAVAKMVENIQGWDRAVLNNIIETAKAHGIKRVFIQSAESKHLVNKGEKGEPTNKYKRIYNEMPQEMGFKEAKYEDYQGHSPENGEMKGQKVWVLDLAGGEVPDPNQMSLFEKKPDDKGSE